MAKWFGKEGETEEEAGKAVEAQFGKVVDERMKPINDKLAKVDTLEVGMNSILSRFQKEDEEKEARRVAAANRKNEEAQLTPEERTEKLLDDPNSYIDSRMNGLARVTLATAAKQAIAETLGSKPHYHGDLKTKIDNLVKNGTQDMTQWSNPMYILNCYNAVVGENFEEIQAGKFKRDTSMLSFNDGQGSGKNRTDDKEKKVEFKDNKTAYAAKMLGLSDDDMFSAAESGEIHGLEVIH